MDEPFDIDDVTVEGVEPDGASMLLRLECGKGAILLRVPVEKARRLADLMEWAVTPNQAVMKTEENLTVLGPVDTVTKVMISSEVHGRPDSQVFMSMETSSGGRLNLLLDEKVTEDIAVGLVAAMASKRTKH